MHLSPGSSSFPLGCLLHNLAQWSSVGQKPPNELSCKLDCIKTNLRDEWSTLLSVFVSVFPEVTRPWDFDPTDDQWWTNWSRPMDDLGGLKAGWRCWELVKHQRWVLVGGQRPCSWELCPAPAPYHPSATLSPPHDGLTHRKRWTTINPSSIMCLFQVFCPNNERGKKSKVYIISSPPTMPLEAIWGGTQYYYCCCCYYLSILQIRKFCQLRAEDFKWVR